ncbi:hypothetical protein V6N11_044552 [Hibiscus sabdariffa]|uniref:Uncharacterized protein n=1 Tax=Hibiscus sabdariffa TaxID=183260 RepID=A0ABR2N937_9ROSI
MVADMVDDSGSWDWNRISQRLLQDMLEKIDVVKPSQYGLGTDNPSWQWEENRIALVRYENHIADEFATAHTVDMGLRQRIKYHGVSLFMDG